MKIVIAEKTSPAAIALFRELDGFDVHPIHGKSPRLAFVTAAAVGEQRGLLLPDQRNAAIIALEDAL